MEITINRIISILIVLITLISVNSYISTPIPGIIIPWIFDFILISIIIRYTVVKKTYNIKYNYLLSLYFIYLIIGIIRGALVAEEYWDYKQLVMASFALSLPILIYLFSSPLRMLYILRFWIRYALPLFGLVLLILKVTAYHFYLGPVLFLSCFLPILRRKWQIIFTILLLMMLFGNFGARSQVIKAAVTLLMSLAYLISTHISSKSLKIMHWLFYIAPIILLITGITGKFNLFEAIGENQGKFIESRVATEDYQAEDLAADTRTSLYEAVITSAVKHNYIWFGRTPARGNDYSLVPMNTRPERHSNEFCFPNVFTWLGLTGIILYCLLYLTSSWLSLYRSNNIFMQLIGVLIAFHFAYGWVEDTNQFDIYNISLWMLIAMGFSEEFRKMGNLEFKIFINSIFIKPKQIQNL